MRFGRTGSESNQRNYSDACAQLRTCALQDTDLSQIHVIGRDVNPDVPQRILSATLPRRALTAHRTLEAHGGIADG